MMKTSRLEAFSDGVLAIIITIMVLEMKPPHEATLEALVPLWPVFLSYVLSFVYLGIYWNNHHHLFQVADHVKGVTLWTNLHVLFWLSLIPFVTAWMGENHFGTLPVALYGIILLMAACAWEIQRRVLVRDHEPGSAIAQAISRNRKEWVSLVVYMAGIVLSFVLPWLGIICYAAVAVIWLIPDQRIEKQIEACEAPKGRT